MDTINILALTKYSYEGPSSRYRFYNYQKCFKQNGIEMTIRPLFSKSYFTTSNKPNKIAIVFFSYLYRFFLVVKLLIFKDRYKLILIEYELLPYFPAIFEYLLCKRGIRYVVDYDDAIFHKYDMNGNKIIKMVLKDKIAQVMKYADTVIVCNAYLESYAKKYNVNIMRLPTVVQMQKYQRAMEAYQKRGDDTFVIGWIGSRTTSVYILEILPAIRRFVDTYPSVRFDLVGFDSHLLSDDDLREHHIRILTWAEEHEIDYILAFDVGIMPLRDDPWSRGKCGFKLVQYMSCKKPVIASPVGINSSIVREGINGLLAESEEAWFDAFCRLYTDRETTRKMGEAGYKLVQEQFNDQKNCKNNIDLIKKSVK